MTEQKPDSYFERLWGQAVLAVSHAEEEAGRAAQRIAEAAGQSQDEIRRQARELTERLSKHRKALETGLEEGVRKALARLQVPRKEQIQEIHARLDKVAARLDALGRR